jgi:hypothetical protein
MFAILASLGVMGLAAYYSFADNRMYMNGELSMKHSLLEKNCEKCHTPWNGVSDESCVSCHKNKEHLADKDSAKGKVFHEKQVTCLTCHNEHRGKRHDLKVVEIAACDGCHEDHKIKETKKEAAAKGAIFFPHQLHLENDVFAAKSCALCHLKSENGERFVKAKFEETCIMCHELVKHGKDAEDKKMCPTCHLHDKYDSVHKREPVITKALFSHKNHGTFQCADCHEGIVSSGDVADLKLPPAAKCMGCHEKNSINNGCASCHHFHPPEYGKYPKEA